VVAEIYFVCKRIHDEKPIVKRDQIIVASVIGMPKIEDESNSFLNGKKAISDSKVSFGDLIYSVKVPIILLFCRILCFITIYMYHDW
jgi:hypothetical protein